MRILEISCGKYWNSRIVGTLCFLDYLRIRGRRRRKLTNTNFSYNREPLTKDHLDREPKKHPDVIDPTEAPVSDPDSPDVIDPTLPPSPREPQPPAPDPDPELPPIPGPGDPDLPPFPIEAC